MLLDGSNMFQKTLAKDFTVANGVARCALLHKLGEDATAVAVLPRLVHKVKEQVTDGATLPVGDDVIRLELFGRVVYLERYLAAVIHYLQVTQCVAAELRVGGGHLGPLAAFPYNQLALADANDFVLTNMSEGEGSKHGGGHFAGIQLINFRD